MRASVAGPGDRASRWAEERGPRAGSSPAGRARDKSSARAFSFRWQRAVQRDHRCRLHIKRAWAKCAAQAVCNSHSDNPAPSRRSACPPRHRPACCARLVHNRSSVRWPAPSFSVRVRVHCATPPSPRPAGRRVNAVHLRRCRFSAGLTCLSCRKVNKPAI